MKCKTAVSLLPSKDPAEAKHERMFDVPCGLYCSTLQITVTFHNPVSAGLCSSCHLHHSLWASDCSQSDQLFSWDLPLGPSAVMCGS